MHSYTVYPWRYRHPPERLNAVYARTVANASARDEELIARIRAAFRLAATTDVGPRENMWLTHFADKNAGAHRVLLEGDVSDYATLLRDPASSYMHYGFDGPTVVESEVADHPVSQEITRYNVYDALLSLASALAIVRTDYPEASNSDKGADVETIVTRLDDALGFRVEFPNPFRADLGIASSRGVITHRAIMALYQAWRIAQLVERRPDARVVEIGAGLGRNAFYAYRLGLRDYTIVDLPTTGVCQAYFLGRTLGSEAVSVFGEAPTGFVKILPPSAFLSSRERYDLVMNVDSMTEFSPETAQRYVEHIFSVSALFLSINHEANTFTVRELAVQNGADRDSFRMPHWMRRGYVEEIFRSPGRRSGAP